MIVLGIDPGVTGALALVDMAGPRLVSVLDMPVVSLGRRTRIAIDGPAIGAWLKTHGRPDCVVLEQSIGRSGDGDEAGPPEAGEEAGASGRRFGGGAHTQFMKGGVFVTLLTLFWCSKLPMQFTGASVWKRRALLPSKLKPTQAKHASLDLARTLFGSPPEFRRVKDHNRAESALIAFYGLPERVVGKRAKVEVPAVVEAA